MREIEQRLVAPAGGGEAPSLRDRMAHHAVPGVALALVAGSEIAVEAAYGVKEAGRRDPVTQTTRFQACSISKPVAALGMLRLVERGVLDLDADVNEVLTSWTCAAQRRVAAAGDPAADRQPQRRPDGRRLPGLPPRRTVADARRDSHGNVSGEHGGHPGRHAARRRVPLLGRWDDRPAAGARGRHRRAVRRSHARARPRAARDVATAATPSRSPTSCRAEAATAHEDGRGPVEGGWHVYPELAAAGLWTTPGDLARFAIASSSSRRCRRRDPRPELTASSAHASCRPGRSRLGGLDSVGLGLFLGGPEAM